MIVCWAASLLIFTPPLKNDATSGLVLTKRRRVYSHDRASKAGTLGSSSSILYACTFIFIKLQSILLIVSFPETWHENTSDCYIPGQDRRRYAEMSKTTRSCTSIRKIRILYRSRRTPTQACYRSNVSRVRAYNYLSVLCTTLPVHIIYGAINDYLYVHLSYISASTRLNANQA